MSTDDLRKAARRNLKSRNDFKVMLAIFIVITLVLVAIWFFTTGGSGYFWPAWPILGFTIASVFAGLDAYGITRRDITESDIDREVERMNKRSGGTPPDGGLRHTGRMCGRFAMDEKTNDLIEAFVLDGNDYRDWVPSFSIAPTDVIPVIRERRHSSTGEVTRQVEAAVWDFRPAFITEPKRPQFNARIETLTTSGMWKSAFAGSRCIVPMRGYYEWTERDEGAAKPVKIPYFIHGEVPMLAAAGLTTARKVKNAEGEDEWEVSTVIITREARDASGAVHDRMPAFLTPDLYDRWLDAAKITDDGERDDLLATLDRASTGVASTITTYEVDRRVNNSRTADPQDASLIDAV